MNIIVFSKNRAAQLELFIRSFKKYVVNPEKYTIKIIYLFTDQQYELGYDKLIQMKYSNVQYIREINFKQDIISCIELNKRYLTFFVDDNVFKNSIDFYDNQMHIFDMDREILCRSLRLHPNLTYCYPEAKPMRKPNFLKDNVFYWKGMDGDYGYPMSTDGHIFRTTEIYPYITRLHYINPNTFEGIMAAQPMNLPKMICYDNSVIVNNPCNKVQIVNNNIHGKIDIKILNNNFLSGQLISLNNIDGIENISCHQELEIIYD